VARWLMQKRTVPRYFGTEKDLVMRTLSVRT